MLEVFKYSALPILAYLVGSIPFGLVLAKVFSGKDIRTSGSGNIGATNVLRTTGVKLGVMTLALDALKGALPVYLAICLLNNHAHWGNAYPFFVGLCAFLGHLYPLYFRLQGGGKGVATAWGCFLILSPVSALTASLVFGLMILVSKRVSVASLAGAVTLPFALWFGTHVIGATAFAAVIAVLIAHRHRQNIVRLLQGTEPAIWGNKQTD